MATLWQEFCSRWKDGCGSSLCSGAKKCLAKGKIPCDILFVGEAPNGAADLLGVPFIDEIGLIMDDVIKKAQAEHLRCAFTNIVCCVPRDPMDYSEEVPPPGEAILTCRRRLLEFIELCGPKLIMAVGNYAENALRDMHSEDEITTSVAWMPHPATVLYARPYGGYEFRRLVDTLTKAVAENFAGAS